MLLDSTATLDVDSKWGRIQPSEVFTASRLLLVPILVNEILNRSTVLIFCTLSIFVLTDVGDGVIARRRGEESLRRRTLDSVIDRIATHSAFLTVAAITTSIPLVWVALIVRDLFQFHVGIRAAKQGFVGVGESAHKAIGICTAICGGWLVARGSIPAPATVVTVTALTWCTFTYVTHMKSLLRAHHAVGIVRIPSTLEPIWEHKIDKQSSR